MAPISPENSSGSSEEAAIYLPRDANAMAQVLIGVMGQSQIGKPLMVEFLGQEFTLELQSVFPNPGGVSMQYSIATLPTDYVLLSFRSDDPSAISNTPPYRPKAKAVGILIGDWSHEGQHYRLCQGQDNQYHWRLMIPLGAYPQPDANPESEEFGPTLSPFHPLHKRYIPPCQHVGTQQPIEVVALYTEDLLKLKGRLRLETEIQQAVNLTNMALANSQVDHELQLSLIAEVPNHLDGAAELESEHSLWEKIQAYRLNPQLQSIRDDFRADVIAIFLRNSGGKHFGWASREDFLTLLKPQFMYRPFLLAHEFGHLLSAGHDEDCYDLELRTQAIMANYSFFTRIPHYAHNGSEHCPGKNISAMRSFGKVVAGNYCPWPDTLLFLADHYQDRGQIDPPSPYADSIYLHSPALRINSHHQALYAGRNFHPGDNALSVQVHNPSGQIQTGHLELYRFPLALQPDSLRHMARSGNLTLSAQSQTWIHLNAHNTAPQWQGEGLLVCWVPKGGKVPELLINPKRLLRRRRAQAPSKGILSFAQHTREACARNGIVLDLGASSTHKRQAEIEIPFHGKQGEIWVSMGRNRETDTTWWEEGGQVNALVTPRSSSTRKIAPGPGHQQRTRATGPDRIPQPEGSATLHLTFRAPHRLPPGQYPIHLEQWLDGKMVGACTISINALAL